MSLVGKHILLGVSGSIAAYKSADLTRRLREAGAIVRVVMTPAAAEFVTPLTFQALSGNPVHTHLLDPQAEAAMGHIELGHWADVVLIAPASADFIAKLTHGLADDLLSTLCLVTEACITLAPAMNPAMWTNRATQDNIEILQERGITLFGPAQGAQACGDTGMGRMEEPAELVAALSGLFTHQALQDVDVLITAGPTREPLDPVRYITNRSSGKMGFALAQAAIEAGARVTLISGPVTLRTPPGVRRIDVETAAQMYEAVMHQISGTQIFIACAAVADYRPEVAAAQKIKKNAQRLTLQMTQNPDIVASVAKLDTPPFIVGFAAETRDLEKNAQAKLKSKGLNMIAANRVGISGSGFESDENTLFVYWQRGHRTLGKASKYKLAQQLIQLIEDRYAADKKSVIRLSQPHC
jgi:phosphopantothenoylcysteine decarboxylase/phosphopantothenate--cysteine ligase